MRRAIVDGYEVDFTRTDADIDAIWDAMRREGLDGVCPGCSGRVHTRATPYGLGVIRVFAHNPGYGERCRMLGGTGEGPLHEALKEHIVRTARAGGWQVDVEVVSPCEKVRADVLCTKDGRTHSWEAQLAGINRRDVNQRHERYVHTWGDTTWVHTGHREWSKDIPCVRVDEEEQRIVVGGIYVNAEERVPEAPLALYVPRILDRNQIVYVTDPFGYYQDSSIAPSEKPKKAQRQISQIEGIFYSRSVCPTEQLDPAATFDLFGDVVTEAVRVQSAVEDTGWWQRRARVAAAKKLDGITLDEVDAEALARLYRRGS